MPYFPNASSDVQRLVAALQEVLEIRIVTGQIVLHLNDSRLQQVETKTFRRIAATIQLDKSNGSGAR